MKKSTGFCSHKAIQNRIKEGRTVTNGQYVSRSGKTTQDTIRPSKKF